MKKASDFVRLAEELIQDARRQIEESHRLVDESRKLRGRKDRYSRERSPLDIQKPS